MPLLMTENAKKMRRKRLNLQVKRDPRWYNIFNRYATRIELAAEAGDMERVKYITELQTKFTVLARHDLEKQLAEGGRG